MSAREPDSKKIKLEEKDEEKESPKPSDNKKTNYSPNSASFKIVQADAIFSDIDKTVKEVTELTSLSYSTALILLNHAKWEKSCLYESLYGSSDEEKMLKDANVLPESPVSEESEPAPNATFPCDVCLDDVKAEDTCALSCNHRFCKGCWTLYLKAQVMDEGSSHLISCPMSGCKVLVPYEMVESLVKDAGVFGKYRLLIAKNYVEISKQLKWCPGVGCDNVAVFDSGSYTPWMGVNCICGMHFCFICGMDWHEPMKCDTLNKWLKKCSDDSETSNWMNANTKDCPKCRTMIEKNGGCNHITCRNPSCDHHFCWICLGDWKTHTGDAYNCNRYDEAKNVEAGDARNALKRYIHYYDRYSAHLKAFKFEAKLKAEIGNKMNIFQREFRMSWVDVQFFPNAAITLNQCRTTLMYTYGFAFFLEKSNESEIFEDNQRDLESATETLCGYLENSFDAEVKENPSGFKQKVVDCFHYCESRRKVLIKHVLEGYEIEENSWTLPKRD